MGFFSPKIYLQWKEPVAIRRAFRDIKSQKLTPRQKVWKFIRETLGFSVFLFIIAYFELEDDKNEINWVLVVAAMMALAVVVHIISDIVMRFTSMQMRLTEKGVEYNAGRHFDRWVWKRIRSARVSQVELDGKSWRVLSLSIDDLTQSDADDEDEHPLLFGLSNKVSVDGIAKVFADKYIPFEFDDDGMGGSGE